MTTVAYAALIGVWIFSPRSGIVSPDRVASGWQQRTSIGRPGGQWFACATSMRAEVIESADPSLHDVLVPAAGGDRGLARHDEAIEPGDPRSTERMVAHRAMVTARTEWRKS